MNWDWLKLYKDNKTESEILEQAAIAVESLFIERQGHCPSELYEDGYADAIAQAAKIIRKMK